MIAVIQNLQKSFNWADTESLLPNVFIWNGSVAEEQRKSFSKAQMQGLTKHVVSW